MPSSAVVFVGPVAIPGSVDVAIVIVVVVVAAHSQSIVSSCRSQRGCHLEVLGFRI